VLNLPGVVSCWVLIRDAVQVAEFLSAVSQLYELHIYTMGDKGYAALMADILDPEHRLFVGRVISAVSGGVFVR
jgi:RNA polymerase II subunit A-like phosphatase